MHGPALMPYRGGPPSPLVVVVVVVASGIRIRIKMVAVTRYLPLGDPLRIPSLFFVSNAFGKKSDVDVVVVIVVVNVVVVTGGACHPLQPSPPPKRVSSCARAAALTDFGRSSHVTCSGIAALLKLVKSDGLPDAFSPATQARHRQRIAFQDTDWGPLLQKVELPATDGGVVDVWVQHPLGFWQVAADENQCFKEFLTRVLDETNGTMSLIAYSDEITPGNVLAEKNKRKLQTIYWSIKEFKYPALSNELAWFTICCLRSTECDRLRGGISE
eukprot:4812122-Pyramimonas_sp.AAC.1